MENQPVFMTIRQVAKTGIVPEAFLRRMERNGVLPCVYSGRKCLINYPMLVERLNELSEKGANANE